MKLQILQILFVFFLCDRTRFFLRLQVGDLIDQFFLAVDKILPAFLSSQRFFVKLDRVTEAPKQKCADCEDDKPRVRTHCVGDIDSSRSLDLQEEQQRRHQRFRKKRSEEHTSELQSRLHLVCRLLLEKKKKQ